MISNFSTLHGDMAVPEWNVNENIDIDEENENGQTALHVAVMNNDLKMVKFLLNRGADVNRKTCTSIDDTFNPIECDCANKKYCFHVADEYGNEWTNNGQNSLHLAAKYASEDLVRLVIDLITDINDPAIDGSTALHYATQNSFSSVRVMSTLIEAGADVNARNLAGKTPLYLAVKFEKIELVDYLISVGSDINISTDNKSTPLHSALVNCNVELVKFLLNKSASTNVINKHSENLLFYVLRVVGTGDLRLKLIQLLLDNDIRIDSCNNHGASALHVAVQNKDSDLVKLLISRGCPTNIKDSFNMSPLSVAVCTNLVDLARVLLENGADANDFAKSTSVLEQAIIRRNEPMVKLLLEHGADANAGSERNRPVTAACLHKNTRIMEMLIDARADVNYRDVNGRTPLMRTITELNQPMMKHLLRHGANVNERDQNGNTALHVLFESSLRTEDIIEYLLEQGADINIENNAGYTPFAIMLRCFTKIEVLTFVRHVALRLTRNLNVNPKIIEKMKNDRTWAKYLDKSLTELELMKEMKIRDKCSYFDVMTLKYSALTGLFQDEYAVDEFMKTVRKNVFLIYSDKLLKSFHQKKERSRLLQLGSDVLDDMFNYRLPPEIVKQLCEYLSNEEIKKFLD